MPIYEFQCACGHSEEKVIPIAKYSPRLYPKHCGKPMEPVITGGIGTKIARDLQYPYENISLPFKYDKNGQMIRPIVQSKKHEDDICAGAWNGEEWRRNQI